VCLSRGLSLDLYWSSSVGVAVRKRFFVETAFFVPCPVPYNTDAGGKQVISLSQHRTYRGYCTQGCTLQRHEQFI